VFLPFNQGDDGGAGNPREPATGGHRTAYLWEQVWAREGWLEILGRYLIAQRDKKKQIVRRHLPALPPARRDEQAPGRGAADGPGGKYLGPALGRLGQDELDRLDGALPRRASRREHKKVFDTVLVVSDRNVIDSQLQEALFDFERTTGVVATITNKEGSKSAELAEALSGDKKIVVCTIQTFPFASRPCASWQPPRASASP
jgi:type I restriction enzyme R subunit